MEENLKGYDAVIIDFDKGGKTMAGALETTGKTITPIECSSMAYRGAYINVDRIPTKSLVYRAGLAAAAGKAFEERFAACRETMEQKEDLTGRLKGKNYQKLNSNPNITVIDGNARFVSPHIVEMTHNEDVFQVGGEMIFINTGLQALIPPVEDLKDSPYVYTSEGLLGHRELPEKLAIIDGGYVGVEFSSIYAGFDSKVTILQGGDVFLPKEDEEIATAVKAFLENRGIRVLVGVKIEAAEQKEDEAVVVIGTREGKRRLQADAVLVATEYRPNTEGLNLEAAGVKTDAKGGIITDDTLATTAPHIYAMGDVRGGLQFTYISLDGFKIVGSAILGDGSYDLKKRGAAPYSVFLNPSFSRVGLSEKEAVKAGYRVETTGLTATTIPKAQMLKQPAGLLKAVTDEETGLILETHLFCEGSYGMVNMIKLAMDAKVGYTVLRDMIYIHPTMGEAFNDLFAV